MSDDLRRRADEIHWSRSIEIAHHPTTRWRPRPEAVVGVHAFRERP